MTTKQAQQDSINGFNYEYDAEGNPRMFVDETTGKTYSYQEAEAAGLFDADEDSDNND